MPRSRIAFLHALSRAAAATLLALLVACAAVPGARVGAEPAAATPEAAARAEAAGDTVVAAELYSRLAAQSKPPEKQDYALKSVEALIGAGQAREAHDRLAAINTAGVAPELATRKQILAARVAVLTDQPEEALRLIAPVAAGRGISPAHAADAQRVRADAWLRLHDPFGAVRSLIAREQYIAAQEAIAANQREIWQLLEAQPRDAIERERSAAREPVYAGWLALASAVQANTGSPARLAEAVQAWRKQHATHPASDLFLLTLAAPPAQVLERAENVALLLPLSGGNRSVQQAAESVRDGFMAMHAADSRPTKPKVRVLDIGADPERASEFWAQAAREGADLIVGPLGLEAVNALARRVSLDTPTILLTHTSEAIRGNVKQVFQFGLPPEQEAEQAAERAWLDGYRRAAVLFPDSNWGRRLASAFTSRWQRLGGAVVASQPFPPSGAEYSRPVRALLNITQSEQNRADLEKTLGMRLYFSPRAREDIDVIFLAADAARARLIKPQLNYHRAARVPVYATSHVFTGRGERATDADLDGIVFGDMPWMLVADGDMGGLRARVQGGWPFAHTPLDRLYALGVDAYALIGELNRLGTDSAATMSGATSVLRIEENGRVQRSLTWARFSGGVPQLLDRFAKKRGQFEGAP
jgi:outer membrane PBP1 activator LpoA protein